jgi:hypothetical protein
MNLPAMFGATDVIDGDISSRVKVYASSATTFVAGQYAISAQVTNSLGDTAKLKTVIHVDESNRLSPKITLEKNLVYLKVGDKFKPLDYVKGVTDVNDNKMDKKTVKVTSSSVNLKKAGTYSVEFTAETETGIEGHTYLIVVVEE